MNKLATIVLALLAFSATLAFAQSDSGTPPQFKDYSAIGRYLGIRTPPRLFTPEERSFRTRLREAAQRLPDFAGHYIIARWGCGTSCVTGAAIDANTGAIHFFPFSICCAQNIDEGFDPIGHRLNSRLIVFSGLRNEEGEDAAHFYLFDRGRFVFLKSVPRDAPRAPSADGQIDEPAARGPSFDCTKATYPDELAICSDSKLAELDRIAAAAFNTLRRGTRRDETIVIARRLLRERHACDADRLCVLDNIARAIRTYGAIGTEAAVPNWFESYRQTLAQSARSGGQQLAEPQIVRGRCHMDYCSFTQILSIKQVAKGSAGTLLAVEERSEAVKAPVKGGEPQYNSVRVPAFRGPLRTAYAFCSVVKPAAIFYDETSQTYYVDVFVPGDKDGVYGANISSQIYYWAVCHNRYVSAKEISEDELGAYAKSLGYQKIPDDQVGQFTFRTRDLMIRFLGL